MVDGAAVPGGSTETPRMPPAILPIKCRRLTFGFPSLSFMGNPPNQRRTVRRALFFQSGPSRFHVVKFCPQTGRHRNAGLAMRELA